MGLSSAKPPENARELLGGIEFFRAIEPDVLDGLLPEIEWLRAEAGSIVFRQGDPGDALYFVVVGRLRVSATGPDGAERLLGEVARGEFLGELALLTAGPRSGTVRAVRDTDLARLSRESFHALSERYPRALFSVAGAVAERLIRRNVGAPADERISTVGLAPLGDVDLPGFARELVASLSTRADVLLVDRSHPYARASSMEWLHEEELRHRLTLLQADADDGDWSRRCLRQADRLLLVADAQAPPQLGAHKDLLFDADLGATRVPELVLVHRHDGPVTGTEHWLSLGDFAAHHHLRRGHEPDSARLARRLLGRSIGLVLGGGGSRAFAEIGVLRALRDAGIPVDRVGGASIGGILAAQVAAGWDPERMLEVNREEWQRTRIDRAWTLPVMALTSPARQVRMLERMFGDVRIEDLWLPFFCVTVNLSRCELSVHRRGPVVQWTNATAAPPALQPPVVGEGGELYIDGGVLDNLPTDVMCEGGSGPVVAINVSPFQEMAVDAGEEQAPSSLRFLMGALTGRASSFPNIVKVIYRTAKVTGLQREEANRKLASLYIEPPLESFGLTDYAAIDRIVEIGYRHACRRLEEEVDLVAEWSSW